MRVKTRRFFLPFKKESRCHPIVTRLCRIFARSHATEKPSFEMKSRTALLLASIKKRQNPSELLTWLTLRRELQHCDSALDVGCGPSSTLRNLGTPRLTGLDAYPPAIEKARQLKTHDDLVLGDVRNLLASFKPKSFDACVALDVIEHLPKPERLQTHGRDGANRAQEGHLPDPQWFSAAGQRGCRRLPTPLFWLGSGRDEGSRLSGPWLCLGRNPGAASIIASNANRSGSGRRWHSFAMLFGRIRARKIPPPSFASRLCQIEALWAGLSASSIRRRPDAFFRPQFRQAP